KVASPVLAIVASSPAPASVEGFLRRAQILLFVKIDDNHSFPLVPRRIVARFFLGVYLVVVEKPPRRKPSPCLAFIYLVGTFLCLVRYSLYPNSISFFVKVKYCECSLIKSELLPDS